MTLSKKEVESVLKLSPFERYQYFIKKVADYEELWTIVDDKNELALSEIDNNQMISLWSASEYIQSNLGDGWENCRSLKLDLDSFEQDIMPVIIENEYLLNVFSVNNKSGFVVSISEFIRDLNEELNNY
ncbi:DUF2750 domain-containing protein [Persicobacter diffluens]|uniref:DUF2750 domain-containing protein n=1 Tax=Persicobacter diffluens TaxID=981 RepID=A0AAN5AQ76_9BACT|nr:hypothetical protein PEDI_55730 [Persicobacter diffluens]